MNSSPLTQFVGTLCLYLMNCCMALATAYGLGSIFKAPNVELALLVSIHAAYALIILGALNALALIVSAMRSRPHRHGERS